MEKVKINIVPKGLKPACYVSQNDNGRVVRFELFDELTPYTLDGSETITITVVRPDGVELVSSVVNTEDSYIDVVFNDDMTAIAGIADCELTITDGETVLGSRNFDMNIEIDAYNGKDVVIETATGVIASFNTEVEDNALEYESEIPYNAEGYTGLRVINSRSTPAYDKTPYIFRKTPSGYGNSCIEKLNGLTVAFNQLVQNGNFENTSVWSVVTANFSVLGNVGKFTSTAQNGRISQTIAVLSGHKYLLLGEIKASSNLVGLTGFATFNSNGSGNWETFSIIVPVTTSGNAYFITRDNRSSDWDEVQIRNYNCIDLTAFFGSSTIADYLYNLETQTAGAGVQKFKELGFDKSYYEYNAGSLLSSKPVSKKVVGFNQWSEEWRNGYYDANGVFFPNSSYVASKDKITILPNSSYAITCLSKYIGRICFYDKNNSFISSIVGISSLITYTFTTPNNAYYLTFDMTSAYGNAYKNDICINISDPEKNGTYEPYSEETYNLGGDELRGLLKLDANNNVYAYGDNKTSYGNIDRKFALLNLGSLNWINESDIVLGQARVSVQDLEKPIKWRTVFLCGKYFQYNNTVSYSGLNDGDIALTNSEASPLLRIRKEAWSSYTNAQIKEALDGVYIVYETTPTIEESTPFDNPQEVKVTEEFIDGRAVEIPVGHDTIYGTDIEYLDIDFDTTIFGGDINAIDGVLTSRYNSDGSVKTTPDVIELDPALIPVKAGDNNIFNSASGAQTIRYYNQED